VLQIISSATPNVAIVPTPLIGVCYIVYSASCIAVTNEKKTAERKVLVVPGGSAADTVV
jgi:hypothetical protein